MKILNKITVTTIQVFIAVLLFCPSKNCPAQTKQVIFHHVQGTNGITLGKINAITQDKLGFMWFADQNNGCIIRYDGYRMVSYRNDPFNANSLGGTYPEAILADSDGFIWIGFLGMGLDRFDPETGKFNHYRYSQNDFSSLSNNTVTAILQDHEGTIWIGTYGGLNRFDTKTGTFKHYKHDANKLNSLSSNRIRAIYEDREGTLWVGTGFAWDDNNEGGLNRFDRKNGTFIRYLHDPENPTSLIDNKIRVIYEDSDGNFWVGTRKNGLHKMNRKTGAFKRYPYNPSTSGQLSSPAFKTDNKFDHISFITEDVEGALWIGTVYSGIHRYDTLTKKMTDLGNDRSNGFTDSSGWCAYTSKEGMLWLSTQEHNLFRINPAHVNIPFQKGPIITNCFYIDNGILWIGTAFGLVGKDRKTGEVIQHFVNDPMNPSTISNDHVTSIIKGKNGQLWIATMGGGLNSFDPATQIFTNYKNDPRNNKSITSNNLSKIFANSDGSLWVGTWDGGLDHMNPQTGIFTNYKNNPKDPGSLSQNTVTAICKDSKNRLWVGTGNGGLNLMNPATNKFNHYLHGLKISSIYQDSDGIIWTGTNENLYRFDEASNNFIRFVKPQSGLPFTYVTSILEDDKNNLWLATAPGIIKLNRNRDQSIIYDKNQGIYGGDFYFDKGYKGPQNEFFFGHVGGYYYFSPDKILSDLKAPIVIITDFRIGGKPVKPGSESPLKASLIKAEEIRLTFKQHIFSFDFAIIDYRNPEDNMHLFMLEGYDNAWRNAGTERTAYYFNVPPGDYVFKIKAASNDGIWTEKSIKIFITPAWWNTWLFRIIAFVCIVSLFYVLIRWRMHQKFKLQLERSEKEKQLAEVRQQTAELQLQATELEMQALRAQMNPHFIFNSLNSINRFILQNNRTQASEYLTKFSKLIRMILQNSQASLISLESELESLQLYLELESVRFDHHFEFKISIDDELDTDIIKVPPLIIQPFTENAIWHGLMNKKERGHLEIELYQEENMLCCKITDDGIGRKKAAEIKSKSATTHKSMGMQITANRINMLQEKKQLNSNIKITDLILADGSAGGTEVLLKIPFIEGQNY